VKVEKNCISRVKKILKLITNKQLKCLT